MRSLGAIGLLILFFPVSSSKGEDHTVQAPQFTEIQFKATHNSYRLPDPPRIQIDEYDVWEIELDFGLAYESDDFKVGHDLPEVHHSLRSLGDWVRDCLRAESLINRPLILKLEAKTHKPCGQLRHPAFGCVEDWDERWQTRLNDSLMSWLGERWLTAGEFENIYESTWPTVADLEGRVIVTLQDSRDDIDIELEDSPFFPRELPGLTAAWPPIETEAELDAAIASGQNRITMDEAYRQPWSVIDPFSNTEQ